MSDRDRFLAALEEAGPAGLHSHDARRQGLTGHPSERAAELERMGYSIRREKAFVKNRPGVWFILESTAGVHAGSQPLEAGSRTRVGVDSGGSSEPVPSEPARLFTPPPLNPLRDQEAA